MASSVLLLMLTVLLVPEQDTETDLHSTHWVWMFLRLLPLAPLWGGLLFAWRGGEGIQQSIRRWLLLGAAACGSWLIIFAAAEFEGRRKPIWSSFLPLIKPPSLAAIAIFTFMGTWNDFMGPLLYIADQRLYSLAFGLYAFSVQVGNNPTLTMAGSLLMTVPVIVIFFFAQKYFIQGVTLTGMKG